MRMSAVLTIPSAMITHGPNQTVTGRETSLRQAYPDQLAGMRLPALREL